MPKAARANAAVATATADTGAVAEEPGTSAPKSPEQPQPRPSQLLKS